MSATLSKILGDLPDSLRGELIDALNGITVNFREQRWEPSELNGGKLCEIVFTIVRGYADGAIPSRSAKPRNMVLACQQLESQTQLPRSLRIQVPRMLVALYEIRNNRGVGHAGGEVNPSHMDAVAVLYMSKWLVAELVRVFHGVDTETASEAVDALMERELTLVWSVDGKKRVLNEKLTLRDKTLAVLYSESGVIGEETLRAWVEATNPSAYRRDVLRKAHKAKLVEYDENDRTIRISPKGARYVEDSLLAVA